MGRGLAELPLADRATIANMAPEYGATCGIFPVDAETLRYLRLTGRSEDQIALVEAYYREQGLFHTADAKEAVLFSDDLSWILRRWSRVWRGRSVRRTGLRCRVRRRASRNSCRRCWGPNGNKNAIRQMVRWEGEGGTCVGVGRFEQQRWRFGAGCGGSGGAGDYDSG